MKLKNNKKGFTFAEVLIVVAITSVLMGVVAVSVSEIKKNLNQTKVDSIARQISVAAQENLSKIIVSGVPGIEPNNSGVTPLGYKPSGCEDTDDLYYITSESGNVASLFVPKDTFDNEVMNNTWIIEYDPSSGLVTGVFYTEQPKEENDNLDFYETLIKAKDDTLRKSSNNRKKYYEDNGKFVGYYGSGDEVDSIESKDLVTKITVRNDDILQVKFDVSKSNKYINSDVTLQIEYLGLQSGSKVSYTYDLGGLTSYTETLDTLKDDVKFSDIAAFDDFIPGENIRVFATAYVTTNSEVSSAQAIKTFNSLFYELESDSKYTNRAYIQCTRHLRNLDRVDNTKLLVGAAEQLRNIYVPDGTTFKPINNEELVLFDGANFEIHKLVISEEASKGCVGAGLFATFGKLDGTKSQIINANLVDTKVTAPGLATGAFAGAVQSNVDIINCGVYLSVNYEDEEKAPEPYLSGRYVGGLVGQAGSGLTIDTSFAATVINAQITESIGSIAGGLVGTAGSGLIINKSYADCYLGGGTVAGLVGKADNVKITNSYAAGTTYKGGLFVEPSTAYGLVNGSISANNVYTVFDVKGAVVSRNSTAKTVNNGDGTVRFIANNDTSITINDAKNTNSVSIEDLANKENKQTYLGDGPFVYGENETHPYNFNALTLTDYCFPMISGLDHYGDWYVDDSNKDDVGFFYWEKEVNGSSSSYHYYIVYGTDDHEYISDLCTNHNDGGVITEYGYGYAIKNTKYDANTSVDWDENSVPTYKKSGSKVDEIDANINEGATNAVKKKIDPQGLNNYVVKAYKTASSSLDDVSKSKDLYLKAAFSADILDEHVEFIGTTHTTVGIKLKGSTSTVYYSFCPYFAADIVAGTSKSVLFGEAQTSLIRYNSVYNTTSPRPHQIRSIDQLQYLNYNYYTKNCHTLTTALNFKFYPFLNRRSILPVGYSNVINTDTSIYNQTHDIDASSYTNYTPIAAQSTFMNGGAHTLIDVAIVSEIIDSPISESSLYIFNWFGSEFDGQTYLIKDLSINSEANTVGLFGTTVGSRLNNIVMLGTGKTNSNNKKIATITKRTTSDSTLSGTISDYFIGGVVGLACDATGDVAFQVVDALNSKSNLAASIDNCAIGGYDIVDETTQATTIRGGSAVGGLAGSSTVRISNSSAVVDIKINSQSNYGVCVVGGLVGSASGGDIPAWALSTVKKTLNSLNNLLSKVDLSDSIESVGSLASVYNCYSGGSISFSSYAKDKSKTLSGAFKGYYVGGLVGSNKNTNVNNVVKWDNAWNHSISIFNSYTYMELPNCEDDRIYSIGRIFATCVTPVWQSIYSKTLDICNIIYNCYYYKDGKTNVYDNNFIEIENYFSENNDEAVGALKNQTVSIWDKGSYLFGGGVQAFTYNDMVVQNKKGLVTKYTYCCNGNSDLNSSSYVFTPVIQRVNQANNKKTGEYVHVGRFPSATRITLKSGLKSSSIKPIVGYIANNEEISGLETYFGTKTACKNIYHYGYYDSGNNLIINSSGKFVKNNNYYNSSKQWIYAPNSINQVNDLVFTADWGYKIIYHSPSLSGGTKTVEIKGTATAPTKLDQLLVTKTVDGGTAEFIGWYEYGDQDNVAIQKNGTINKLSFNESGIANVYAGWSVTLSRYFKTIDPSKEGFVDGTEYLIMHIHKGVYSLVVSGDAFDNKTKKSYYLGKLNVTNDIKILGDKTFGLYDKGYTTWKAEGNNGSTKLKYGTLGYMGHSSTLALGYSIIDAGNYTKYDQIAFLSNNSIRVNKTWNYYLRHNSGKEIFDHIKSDDGEKFYVLKVVENGKSFVEFDK